MSLKLHKEQRYSYEDYVTWPEDERWEIMDGVAYNMSPAPVRKHQDLVGNFYIKLKNHPKNRCYTGLAPLDVVFDPFNIVQPDLLVVCDRNKVGVKNIQGAPDLIIEVLSPGTSLKDRREKKQLYERFGVREYLLVDPATEYVEHYRLKGKRYGSAEIVNWDESLKLVILPIELSLWEIFEKEWPQQKPTSVPE